MKDKDRAVHLQDADPLLYTDVGLETVLFLLEQGRKGLAEKESLSGLLGRFGNVFHAKLLYLAAAPEIAAPEIAAPEIAPLPSGPPASGVPVPGPSAQVRYTDFILSKDLTDALCRPAGLYGRLAKIRFTHRFDNNAVLKIAEAEGHPHIGAVAAVPVFKEDRPNGCLAALTEAPRNFTEGYILLLAVAAEIVSIVENRAGN